MPEQIYRYRQNGDTYRPHKEDWHGKPYYSLDAYCKNTYGEKLYKIALQTACTCPNRDGTLDTKGCIFCSVGGSGEFAVPVFGVGSARKDYSVTEEISITKQLAEGKYLLQKKKTGSRYIAYFQAYTNTYGPVEYLHSVYENALREESVAGISIATRPDCLSEEILTVIVNLKEEYPDKFVWIELGLQTIHEETALFIRRSYPLSCFDTAVKALQEKRIPVIVHIIIGLPGEDLTKLLQTIDHMNQLGIQGIKLHLLHILRGTDLAALYEEGKISVLSQEAYLELLTEAITHLSPEIVIHRLTGDGARNLLIAPRWSLHKKNVLNALHHEMAIRKLTQGCKYQG